MAASRDEVYERVREVLVERLSVEEADITEEANFQEDLGADSLDLVEMIMEPRGISSGSRSRMRTPRRSRRSVRLSNTSRRTSSQAKHAEPGRLARLIDLLPAKRAEIIHASFVAPTGRPRTSGWSFSGTAFSFAVARAVRALP